MCSGWLRTVCAVSAICVNVLDELDSFRMDSIVVLMTCNCRCAVRSG